MTRRPIVLACCMLAAGLAGPAASAGAAKRPRVQCSQQADAVQVVRRVTTALRGSGAYRLELAQQRDVASGNSTQTTMLTRGGGQTILAVETILGTEAAGTTRVTFGRGFKGVRTLELVPEGARFRAIVDGRRSQPFDSADTGTVVFEDGQPAPKLRPNPSLVKAMRKLSRQLEKTPCASDFIATGIAQGAPSGRTSAEDDADCLGCQFGCGAVYAGCVSAAIAKGIACLGFCVPPIMRRCYQALELCLYDGCYGLTNVCCPAGCLQASGQTHCCDSGQVCYDVDAVGGGTFSACCRPDRVCGRSCIPDGARCVVPERSWSCGADTPGELCTDVAAPANYFPICCGAGERCGRPASTARPPADWPYGEEQFGHLCCPADSGEACGLTCCPGGKTCCRVGSNRPTDGPLCCDAGQTCDGSSCCPPEQLCGGTCCPGPCVNGVCCAPGRGTPCGGQCCPGGFSSCCNGQCCAGPCVGGACCTPERACGTTCCADGWTCTDPASSTCAPCGEGEKGCAPVAGNPLCCAGGTECCSSGECCAEPNTCCTVDGVTGCRPRNECLR